MDFLTFRERMYPMGCLGNGKGLGEVERKDLINENTEYV